jgi:glycosyltransferase involved in cell wall biosynthesis
MSSGEAQIPLLSVIIPVHNGAATLARCLEAIAGARDANHECIVVDDSSTDDSAVIARSFPVRLLELSDGPLGPAYARNRGAEIACGDILFFVDADVLIAPDTLTKVVDSFFVDQGYDAVFGSYDDMPEAMNFLSQFKNLSHHFVHQNANEKAVTFWSGCGAIRRDLFLSTGGFDEARYPRPSIEDIELGSRLIRAGYNIRLDKSIQVKHLKHWTLRGMVESDIFDRGIPWTRLLLERRDVPNDLNLQHSQRLSALFICILLLHLAVTAYFHNIALLPILSALFFIAIASWHWHEGPALFEMDRLTSAVYFGLLGFIICIAFVLHTFRLLPLLFLLLVASVGAQFAGKSAFWSRVLFAAMVLGIGGSVVLLISSFSIWLAGPLVLLLLAVVTLNFRFYAFLGHKRGFLFAVAAIPLHLLYFLYSTISFAAGSLLFLWSRVAHRRSQPCSPGYDPE